MPRTFFSRTFGNNTGGISSCVPPTAPTLAVADNGDGTGGVATIAGGDAGSTHDVYYLLSAATMDVVPVWTLAGSRAGNGAVALTLDPALYWFYCRATNADGTAVSNFYRLALSETGVLPICERIAQKLVARLQQISIAGGYHLDIAAVERPSRARGIVPDHLKIIVIQKEAEAQPELSFPGNPPATAWVQPFALYLIVRQSDAETADDDTLVNLFAADAQTAICTPPASWHNWDGLAVNSAFGKPVPFETENGAHTGVILQLDVTYRVDETNPFMARP